MPWLATATLCPSCRAAISRIASRMRRSSSSKRSAPGTLHFSGSLLNQKSRSGSARSMFPQGTSSHAPMFSSRSRGSVRTARSG